MTRINIIDPKDLTNRHLVAEYKEITQFLHLVKKRVDNKVPFNDIPKKYTLNKGHCLFFYNKGSYILKRFCAIGEEIENRKLSLDPDKFYKRKQKIVECYHESLMNDYIPTPDEYAIVIDRITQRINEKKHLYPDSDRFFNAVRKYV